MITEEKVLEALKQIIDPDLNRDIVSLGFVKDIRISKGNVAFKIELTTPACPVKDQMKEQAVKVVASLPDVENVAVEMTARVRKNIISPEGLLPNVKNVVAIASGKGGVGKSTVSVNIALALAQQGAKVGLLDADVYGPSVPLLFGCSGMKPFVEHGKLLPVERFNVKLMSLDLLLDDSAAVIWRGPLVASTVKQLLTDVEWGELDYLLVDLPPGTGDAPMTLAQTVPLTGVVIVLTPQEVAASIALKSIQLFSKLNAPIIGLIENMAEFICEHCGNTTRVFSGVSGDILAERLGLPLLGSIPIDPNISRSGDEGIPLLASMPNSKQAHAFINSAGNLVRLISVISAEKDSGKDLEK